MASLRNVTRHWWAGQAALLRDGDEAGFHVLVERHVRGTLGNRRVEWFFGAEGTGDQESAFTG